LAELVIARTMTTLVTPGTVVAGSVVMSPEEKQKKHPTPPETTPSKEGDFAEEVAPKRTEFSTEKDAKEITGGEFDKIP
jgi:hypothetical protein